jgi:hypothetical protein
MKVKQGDLTGWVCPSCDRRFARVGQSHECAPAMTLDEYFSTGPAHERPVFEAVHQFVSTLGPVAVEPVSVGIFLKKSGSFIELRPMTRWVAMSFPLQRTVTHPLMTRRPIDTGRRTYHFVNLRTPDDLTDEIKSWLAESYALVE